MAKHEDLNDADDPRPEINLPTEEEQESLDKTIEDSFPASDPPSSIPDPDEDENAA